MKIITEDGFKYTKKNLKMEGMVICRTNVKNLLIARKYVKPRETEQNQIFSKKGKVTKILWRMISKDFKEDCALYLRLLKRYSRKDREKLRFYSKYTLFSILIESFFVNNTTELNDIKVIEDFFQVNRGLSIKDFVNNGILRRVNGYEMLERRMEI